MKLLLCSACRDVLKLIFRPRACSCGKSSGYCDEHGTAHFAGPVAPMEISDHSVKAALAHPNTNGTQTRVIAWLVSSNEIALPHKERQWHENTGKKLKKKNRRPPPKRCEPAVLSRRRLALRQAGRA